MTIKDYVVEYDHFQVRELDTLFPCSSCKHRDLYPKDSPCKFCGHNPGAVLQFTCIACGEPQEGNQFEVGNYLFKHTKKEVGPFCNSCYKLIKENLS